MITEELVPAAEGPMHYVQQSTGLQMVKLSAGHIYVTRKPERLTTVLGSCVAVCLRNVETGIGGANHFMLPGQAEQYPIHAEASAELVRYGAPAIEQLVHLVLEGGADHRALEAKVFGGASVININSTVASDNIAFAFNRLSTIGIRVVASDVGGSSPRKIIYDPLTGKVQLQRLRSAYEGLIAERERHNIQALLGRTESNT